MKVLGKLPLRDFVLNIPHGRHLSPGLISLPSEHQDKNKNHASYSFVYICSPWLLLICLKQLACLPRLGKKLGMRKEGEPGRTGSFDGKMEAPLGLKGFESFNICPFSLLFFLGPTVLSTLFPTKSKCSGRCMTRWRWGRRRWLVFRHQRGLAGSYTLSQLRIKLSIY